MTANKAYNLWCDNPECAYPAFDSSTWPRYQTVAEVRRAARRVGWVRTKDGRDFCPDCAKEDAR